MVSGGLPESCEYMTTLRGELVRYLSPVEWRRGLPVKAAYVLLHQADILLTSFAVLAGFEELNPVMRASLDTPLLVLALKLLIPVVIAWLVPARLLLPAIALLIVVIGFNLAQLAALL